MKASELIDILLTLDPEADIVCEEGEFGPYDITDVSEGFRNREGYFVHSSARIKTKTPKTYRKAILLY